MSSYTFSCADESSENEIAAVRNGLSTYNRIQTGLTSYQPVALLLRDQTDNLVGGLLGDIYWGWLAINIQWLAENVWGKVGVALCWPKPKRWQQKQSASGFNRNSGGNPLDFDTAGNSTAYSISADLDGR